jgi:hypothetical protein
MPALQSAGQAGSSATSPGVAGTAPSTQQLVATTARAVAAVAAGAAAAAAEEHDDSSDLPELLDTCPFADDTSSSAGSPPGLVAADMGSDGGLAGSSSNNMAGSSGTSSGPPSLASGSDAGSDDVDGLSLPGRAEWPAAGPAAAADEEDDGPPELVSGSDQEDSDEDDQIGAWFSYNAEHVQRQQQQRGTWEPAGLQAGQHSSGLRPGFLQGQALHEAHSINGIGQQQPPAAAAAAAAAPSSFYSMSDSYYNRARSIAAAVVPPPARPGASAAGPAAGADAEDDSGSEGSWETASDQDLEHAAAAGAAAPGAAGRAGRLHTGPSDEEPDLDPLTDDSCEDEDEDDYEDESDYEDDDEDEEEDEDEDEECDCPMCVSMRLINDDLALQRFAASGVATRAMAAAAGSATQAFGRPRSNAFAVPSGGGSRTTTGAVDSLCGDTDAPSSSAAARHPTGIPLLPPRGGKKGASGAGAGASGQQQQLPKDSITADASKARVDGLAVLLSDAAFTQQLLAGLPVSVEPGHSSIQSALEMIRGKSYMPINTVASHMLSGAATVADVQRTDAHIQAQRLLRQWNS